MGVDEGPDRARGPIAAWCSKNIAFGLECARVPRDQRGPRVDELLGIMGLTEWKDRLPGELSGGMRQEMLLTRNQPVA